ncbi:MULTISPECIES: LamB/YcsF family protein [unclassified Mesorhizobium]|uniref:LamB/YcsF family protein n=1 Tax=unclassified Mesorhizobium TaxID=325217 RepID=UPI000467DEFA|nr:MULTISPECIES: 5-oxoprolinase subunit PxpA [unclassified Mesorhizobium]
MASIDLNSDLGESFGPWTMGDDLAMLDIVTSANIACGFHAGDPAGILMVLREAARRDISIGAHVGYRDLVGFGRRNMDPTSAELIGDTIYQIGALQGLAKAAGTTVRYVKPHGALYNTMASDARQAADVIAGIKAIEPSLALMALAGAPIVEQARAAGLAVVCEAFADRAYNSDGSLVSRRLPGSVIHDPQAVAERMLRLVTEGRVTAIDGSDVVLEAQSICVHGDTPAAVSIARLLRDELAAGGVRLKPFIAKNGDASRG